MAVTGRKEELGWFGFGVGRQRLVGWLAGWNDGHTPDVGRVCVSEQGWVVVMGRCGGWMHLFCGLVWLLLGVISCCARKNTLLVFYEVWVGGDGVGVCGSKLSCV